MSSALAEPAILICRSCSILSREGIRVSQAGVAADLLSGQNE